MAIPHSPIPIASIRPNDILFLLAIGGVMETLTRSSRGRSPAEKKSIKKLNALRYEVARLKTLGPSTFVETSKLERKVLLQEKELVKIEEEREKKKTVTTKRTKIIKMILNIFIFALYYGVPLLAIDRIRVVEMKDNTPGMDFDEDLEMAIAGSYWKGVLFPLGYIGFGMKLARFGLKEKASSVSALAVYWSAQVFVRNIHDCVESLSL